MNARWSYSLYIKIVSGYVTVLKCNSHSSCHLLIDSQTWREIFYQCKMLSISFSETTLAVWCTVIIDSLNCFGGWPVFVLHTLYVPKIRVFLWLRTGQFYLYASLGLTKSDDWSPASQSAMANMSNTLIQFKKVIQQQNKQQKKIGSIFMGSIVPKLEDNENMQLDLDTVPQIPIFLLRSMNHNTGF